MKTYGDKSEPRIGGVDYSVVRDKASNDPRYSKDAKPESSSSSSKGISATFDAFIRLQAGVESRTLSQKIADSNRPTWESYKKENEEKLDIAGKEVRQMIEYRKELDKERDLRLSGAKRSKTFPSSDSDDSSDDRSEESKSKSKKSKKSKKKSKKEKKKKKKQRKEFDDSDSDSSSVKD